MKARKTVVGTGAKRTDDYHGVRALLREAVSDGDDERSHEEPLKLQGRCGAVVLHLLYQAGLVPAKQLEVSSGSGERSGRRGVCAEGHH